MRRGPNPFLRLALLWTLLWALLWPLVACEAALTLPPEAAVDCTSDAECPEGFECRLAEHRCYRSINNGAPSLTLGAIERSTTTVALPTTLFDPDADSLDVTFTLVQGELVTPLTVDASARASSPAGTPHALSWNAAAHFGDSHYRPGLVLRVVPRDPFQPGAPVTSEPFVFGNDAPELTEVSVGRAEDGSVQGTTVIRFVVRDSSSDPVHIQAVRLHRAGGTLVELPLDTTAAASFPGATLTGLTSSPGGTPHTFLWNTAAAAPFAEAGATLELVVADWANPSAAHATEAFTLANHPVVTQLSVVDVPGRPLDTVELSFVLRDPNGSGVAAETVDLDVEYSADGLTWWPASASATSEAVALTAELAGSSHTFVWDALTDAEDATRVFDNFDAAAVDLSGDGSPDTNVIASRPSVWLRVTPIDSSGLAGDAVSLDAPLTLGNLAPNAALSSPGATVSGEIPLEVVLRDGLGDAARIEVQFSVLPSGPWRTAHIVRGAVSGLSTSPTGDVHLVVWRSTSPEQASTSAPQGIGFALRDVALRARAIDEPQPGVLHFGAWNQLAGTVRVVNQTPPRLEGLYAKSDPTLRNGVVPISYRLIDAEGDAADIHLEASYDGGTTWSRCVEYPDPRSEGAYDLASAPLAADGTGGIAHTYFWDSQQDVPTWHTNVALRLVAHDDFGRSPPTVLTLGGSAPTGPPESVALFASPVASYSTAPSVAYSDIETADLNDDGALDLAITDREAWVVRIFLANTSGGKPTGSFAAGVTFGTTSSMNGLVLADLNGDGREDVVAVNGEGTGGAVRVYLGNGTGAIGNATFTLAHTSSSLGAEVHAPAVGDFNEDGALDVVAMAKFPRTLQVLLGNGTGALGAASPIALSYGASFFERIAVGDLDGDGHLDLATAANYAAPPKLELFRGRGDGTFEAAFAIPLSGVTGSLAAHDLDADGDEDLVVGTDAGVAILRSAATAGSGFVFAATERRALGGATGDLRFVDGTDDGVPDLVVTQTNTRVLMLPAAATDLALRGEVTVASINKTTYGTVAGEWTGDGVTDFVNISTELALIPAAAAAVASTDLFSPPTEYPAASGLAGIVAADFDWDGSIDVASFAGAQGLLARNERVGTAPTGRIIYELGGTFTAGSSMIGVGLGDVDGDGDFDLVGPSLWSRQLAVCVAGELGSLPCYTAYDCGPSCDTSNMYTMGQLGGADRLADVALVAPNQSGWTEIPLLQSLGDGSFDEVGMLAVDEETPIAAADLDHDGIDDLVTLASPTLVHSWRGGGSSGLPNGSFSLLNSSAITAAVYGILVDMNADGLLDLVTSVSGDLYLSLGLGTNGVGNGAFAAPVTVSDTEAIEDFAVADINLDGAPDVVVLTDAKLRVCQATTSLGVGTGSCTMLDTGSAGPAPKTLALADLNADGMLDAAIQSEQARYVARLGRRYDPRTTWTQFLGVAQLAGGTLLANGDDRFGAARQTYVALHRDQGGSHGAVQGARSRSVSTLSSFDQRLRTSGLTLPAGLVPLTGAYHLSGLERVVRVHDPDGDGTRLELAKTATAGALLEVELPIVAARPSGSIGANVRVYVERRRYRSAAEEASDPFHTHPSATSYLPRATTSAGERDVLHAVSEWVELPRDADGDFATGSGARFVVDLGSSPRRVRVLTEHQGTLAAFLAY